MKARKYHVDKDTGHDVVAGVHYSGLAKVCKTEAEASNYIAGRKNKDKWAGFAIVKKGEEYHVIVRQN